MEELIKELRAIEEQFESRAPWSESALYSGIRHVQRNTDIFEDALYYEEGGGEGIQTPGRYDGTPLAKLRNILPRLISALEAQQ